MQRGLRGFHASRPRVEPSNYSALELNWGARYIQRTPLLCPQPEAPDPTDNQSGSHTGCDFESHDYSYSFDSDLQNEWVWSERYPSRIRGFRCRSGGSCRSGTVARRMSKGRPRNLKVINTQSKGAGSACTSIRLRARRAGAATPGEPRVAGQRSARRPVGVPPVSGRE